jgi:hypothetical protein
MTNDGLQRASRCGARGTRLESTAAGPASSQARGGASVAADRMIGVVRLSSREMPPAPEQQLGAPVADDK